MKYHEDGMRMLLPDIEEMNEDNRQAEKWLRHQRANKTELYQKASAIELDYAFRHRKDNEE